MRLLSLSLFPAHSSLLSFPETTPLFIITLIVFIISCSLLSFIIHYDFFLLLLLPAPNSLTVIFYGADFSLRHHVGGGPVSFGSQAKKEARLFLLSSSARAVFP